MSFSARCDEGSAVVDFVLVLTPATLLSLPLVSLFSIMHQGLVTQQVAYEIARYGTLADTSDGMRARFARTADANMSVKLLEDETSCRLNVTVSKDYEIAFWPVPINLESEANAQCETF